MMSSIAQPMMSFNFIDEFLEYPFPVRMVMYQLHKEVAEFIR